MRQEPRATRSITRCISGESPIISRSLNSRSIRSRSDRFSLSSDSRMRFSFAKFRELSIAAAPIVASEARNRRSSSTKLPGTGPRSSLPTTPTAPRSTSPARSGATSTAPPRSPRKSTTVVDKGVRIARTRFTGSVAITRSADSPSLSPSA